MAEEEVAAAAPSPVPSDHKRKLEDVEPQAPSSDKLLDSALEPDADDNDVAASDSSEAKRPRLDDDKIDGLGNACLIFPLFWFYSRFSKMHFEEWIYGINISSGFPCYYCNLGFG